jgi:hypothetical protein
MGELFATEATKISASALTFIMSFLVAMVLVTAANMRFYSMGEEVNRRLPENAKIDLFGFGANWRMYKVLRLHAEMYPESPKRWQAWTLVAFAAVFLFGGFFLASWVVPR